MITFLRPKELCFTILSIKLDDHNQFNSLRPSLKELIPKGKFPLVNLKAYQEDQKNGIDFVVSLKKNNFSFIFNDECFNQVFKPNTFSFPEATQSPDYFVLIVLYSYLAWYFNFIQKCSTQNVATILQALLDIMDVKSCKIISKSRTLAASSFFHIYSEIVESSDFVDVTSIYPALVQFLTMNTDLPETAFDLLLKLGNRVIDKSSKKFTAEMSAFCNFVVMIIRTCGNRFPSCVSTVIVTLMKTSLVGLDKDALSFFGRSLDTLGVDTADSIISELPEAILKFIKSQEKPLIPFENAALNDTLVFPPRKTLINDKIVTHSSLQNDINELLQPIPSFPPVLPIKQIVNNDLLEIFDLILKIVDNKQELKQILLKNINALLIGCEISNFYYDIFASFLYFLLLLYPNSSISPFPEDIFLARLFNQNYTVFNQSIDYSQLYTIRHLSFLMLFQQTPDIIRSSVSIIQLKPGIFAEFLYKILAEINHIDNFTELCGPLFESIVSAISFYEAFESISDEFAHMSNGAMISAFTFLNEVLKTKEYLAIFFNSHICINHLISFIYERPIRQWSLSKILEAFTINHYNTDYIANSLEQLINKTFHFGYSKEEILQAECLINFLNNDFFNVNSNIVMNIIKPNVSLICRWIAGMPKYILVKQQGTMKPSLSGDIPIINQNEKPHIPTEPPSSKISPRNKHSLRCLIMKSSSNKITEFNLNEKELHQNSMQIPLVQTTESNSQSDLDEIFKDVYEYGSSLLILILEALTSFSGDNLLSQSDLSAIETTANIIYGHNPNNLFFDKLCCVVSGQFLKETSPSFIIKQPKMMKLFISLYQNSNDLQSKAEFIESLCTFNKFNCEQLEKGSFDLFLIERLAKYRNDYSFENKIYDIYLRIIRLISAEASSVAIVHQYISLLCSVDHDYLPRFYPNILNCLQQQLQNSRKLPATPLPIFSSTQITASNIQLPQTFCVFFWFFVSKIESEHSTVLFSISNEISFFSVTFEKSKFVCSYQQNNEQWAVDLKYQIVTNQWCLATFSVVAKPKDKEAIVRPAFNGDIIQSGVFPYFDFSQSTSQVIVGKTKNDEFNIFLGSFGITNYFDSSENISMFDEGPRKTPSKPVLFFTTHDKNDDFALDVLPENIEYTFQKVRTLHKPSFTDLLIDVCGISALVPILHQIDNTFSNGNQLPFLLDTFVEILEMSLTLSYNAQVLFSSEKCFLMISHLLLRINSEKLTYKVFLRFCSIFDLLDDEKCRIQLYFCILLRLPIWIRSAPQHFKKIIRYWVSSLIPLNLELTLKRITFCDILSSLRIFFPYEINQPIMHFSRMIEDYNDIKMCRDQMMSIALMIASQGLDSQQFKYLIILILELDEDPQVIDLLHLLEQLIDQNEKVQSKSKYSMSSIVYLMFLYSNNLEILDLALNIVIKAFNLNLLNTMTLPLYTDVAMHQLPGCYGKMSVLEKLMDICIHNAGHLFPLCAMITVSLGEKYFEFLLNKMKPNVCYCGNQFWSLWPTIALYRFDCKLRIIQFLVDVSPSQWKNVFWMIDNVGRILKEDSESYKKKFINEIIKKVQNLPEYDELIFKQFFNLIPQYLFLQPKRQSYEQLFNQTEQKDLVIELSSSYYEEEEDSDSFEFKPLMIKHVTLIRRNPTPTTMSNNYTNSNQYYRRRSSSFHSLESSSTDKKDTFDSLVQFKMTDLFEKVKMVISDKNFYLYFGLRIENNKWKDEEIVLKTNQIFSKYPHSLYYNTICFINAFLLHFNKENAVKTVGILNLLELKLFSPEISLFNKHAHQMSVKQLTDEAPSLFLESSNNFLKNFENAYHSNRLLTDLLKNLETSFQLSEKLKNEYETKLLGILRENTTKVFDTINLRNTKYSKAWTRFWKTMTMKRAPWYQSLSSHIKMKEDHYRRDFSLCPYFCPFKLRPNNSFNLHTEASQKRDVGHKKKKHFRRSANLSQISLFKTLSSFNLTESTGDIFTDRIDSENSSEIKIKRQKLFFESPSVVMTVSQQYDAFFSIQKDSVIISKEDQTAKVIKIDLISAVLQRTYLQRETAIEIFTKDGSSLFINFPDSTSKDIIGQFQLIKRSLQCPFLLQTQNPMQFVTFLKCASLWTSRKISNFEYLMLLNVISGRSFNVPSQYPIVPWILSDYTSEQLDLNNPNQFRDLSKPAGALGTEKFKKLKENMDSIDYLYSSGNISPILLYLWLVRMEPFATLQIKEQNDQFDLAERQFKSINESYQNVLNISFDFRELIPEFFFDPEFLLNRNHFDLGQINGKRIDNVELPTWIKKSDNDYVDAFEFIYMHRKALESEFVSSHLHQWIDLIWGYKSRGNDAIEANNIYMPEMYPEIWKSDFSDAPSTVITEIEDILQHIGQIPMQLFTKPHPIREKFVENTSEILFYQLELTKTHYSIGKIFYLSDMKTIGFFTIDDNGICIETHLDYQALKLNQDEYQRQYKIGNSNSPISGEKKSRQLSVPKNISNLKLSKGNLHASEIISESPISMKKASGSVDSPDKTHQKLIWMSAFSSSASESATFSDLTGEFMISPISSMTFSWISSSCGNPKLWKKFFLVHQMQPSDIYLVNLHSGKSVRVVRQRSDITAMATDGVQWLAVANKDSKISLYLIDNIKTELLKEQFSIPSFRASIKCCDLSSSFQLLVCGTRDNSLMFCSLQNKSIVKTIELDSKPILLLITPSWGFTVAYLRSLIEGKFIHYIAVFSANGVMIRKVEILSPIKKMTTFKDSKGFDYVLMANDQNEIFFFEAFYCDIGDPVFQAPSNIVALSYMINSNSIVVLCEDAFVYLIPESI